MRVEVDQSIRIDNTRSASIFAFSDGNRKAILVSAKVKRECLLLLRDQGRTGASIYIDLFAASLWLLLCEGLSDLSQIVIDTEFSRRSQQARIKERLFQYARKEGLVLRRSRVFFRKLTKDSPAHKLAYNVHRQKIPPDRKIETRELLSLVK